MAAKQIDVQPAAAPATPASPKGNKRDYHLIFKNAMSGMAVASLGGALLDCNGKQKLSPPVCLPIMYIIN